MKHFESFKTRPSFEFQFPLNVQRKAAVNIQLQSHSYVSNLYLATTSKR